MKQLLSWIFSSQPTFCVRGESISVIKSPSEFFGALKTLARASKSRTVLSSLYLGNGPMETELVSSVQHALTVEPDLRVRFLFDYTRGTRGTDNSCTVVHQLLKSFPDRFRLSLYHTPHLRGWVKWLLPARYNEVVGLQHMKIYCFDDTLLISGANLSELYFTQRQDRYIRIDGCPELCDYCEELVQVVSRLSFLVTDDGIKSPVSCEHPIYGDLNKYVAQFRSEILALNEKWQSKLRHSSTTTDTKIAALLQMGPFGIDHEHVTTQQLIRTADLNRTDLDIATGYFNLTNELKTALAQTTQSNVNIVLSSPQANGFHSGSGLSGYIPALYTQYARNFYDQITKANAIRRVHLWEYIRDGWSFHAKGLWLDTALGYTTLVGSTNFGYRSAERDLELQLLICTSNDRLKADLQNECDSLRPHLSPITELTFEDSEHDAPFFVRWASYFLRKFM